MSALFRHSTQAQTNLAQTTDFGYTGLQVKDNLSIYWLNIQLLAIIMPINKPKMYKISTIMNKYLFTEGHQELSQDSKDPHFNVD